MYYYRPMVDDEIYGFGFGVNVLNGLVPYKDFNMIITPLFSYVVAIFLGVFGEYLIIYHIIISLIIVIITFISYRKIGISAVIVYLLLLIYPFTGYNMFSLLLLFILFSLDEKGKYYLVIEVLVISMMILTKQVLGLLVIPSLIYSKNRKKSFLIYLGIGLLFVLSLVYNGCLYEFFDYCLFGMFDFSSQNNEGFNFWLLIELFIIGLLLYQFIKKREKNVLYLLCFQIMCFPIVNYPHFMISFVPFIFYWLSYKKKYLNFIAGMFVLVYFIGFSITIMVAGDKYLYHTNSSDDNFYKGRMVGSHLSDTVSYINSYIDKYEWDRYYLLGNFSYIVKLSNGDKINKYDLINNGNMGYDGASRYIKEIDDYCSNNKCLFIVEYRDKYSTNQTNVEILKYINRNYLKEIGGNVFEIYTN